MIFQDLTPRFEKEDKEKVRREVAALIMSAVAIVISIGIPLWSHYFGNSFELEKKYSPKLVYDENEVYNKNGCQYDVIIYNKGKTPVKTVRVYVWSKDDFIWLPDNITVITNPPSPVEFSVKQKNKQVLVEIQRPLGPGEEVVLTVPNIISPELGYSGMRSEVFYENGNAEKRYGWVTVREDVFDF